MTIGQIHVPPRGNTSASIMIVGEAPGKDEEIERAPFVGRSGQFQARYLGRAGVDESDVFLTNLCRYRPQNNRFDRILDTPQLAKGLEDLAEEIKEVDPNIIIASGNWPMYYLTGVTGKTKKPGTGVNLWRGSTLPCTLVEGYKVYITYHPAYIIRPQGVKWNPVYLLDLQRAIEESETKEFMYPEYESFIDPDDFTMMELRERLEDAELITVDIETFGSDLGCVGITSGVDWGMCLTYKRPGAFWHAEEIIANAKPKNFQFGNFDINWLRHNKGWETRGYLPEQGHGWDTYIATASLMPEFPRGLSFLGSIYTRFPYWKDDRKSWKEEGDLNVLWEYNIKDIIATHTIALEQITEVEELYACSIKLGSSGRS